MNKNEFFRDKVVLVTGGSDGIGKALVTSLLQSGAKVATCGRRAVKFSFLDAEFPGYPYHVSAADVSSEQDCKKWIDSVFDHFGKIDVLINNAGISMRGLVNDTQIETLQRVININFWGAVYCTKYALPHILQSRGFIVGVSSIAGYRGLPGRSGYSASKFALQGWLESLRTELIHSGVHVMWVCPGFTASSIRQNALNEKAEAQGETPLDEDALMTAAECAQHILNAIVKRKRTLVLTFTGKRTVWMNKLFPGLTDSLVYRFFFKNGVLVK
ncbi:MAG: SDR family oxidoreductase [Bacteroidetes bacterium]|nr:SDR family oxidoreductase [Bacteroidota bacterium]